MQDRWSKEDLVNFNSSEVFKELEIHIINTIKRAEILNNKIAAVTDAAAVAANTAALGDLTEAAVGAKKAVDALEHGADDSEVQSEFETDSTDEVLEELRSLAQVAIAANNTKLAYKIERTIDEILEQDVACK